MYGAESTQLSDNANSVIIERILSKLTPITKEPIELRTEVRTFAASAGGFQPTFGLYSS
jgi:hypothetical protein